MRERFLFGILFSVFSIVHIHAQTSGTLTVNLTTAQTATATFAPKNILAIWIEDNSGKFVKTLLAYANTRKTYLNTWEASTTLAGSVYNTVDAVTGATLTSHGTRTCSWNGKDYSGKLVADGTYKVWMELTDQNATGNYTSFTFIKGSANQKQTPTDVLPSFKSITIDWSTTVTSVDPELTRSNTVVIYPNPGYGVFKVLAENIKWIDVYSISGEAILSGTYPVFDLTSKPNGIYFVKVNTGKNTVVKKIIKN
jgi:Predicted periplasmic protein